MDKLDAMFEKQIALQVKLGTIPLDSPHMRQEYINIMSLALIDEVMEALRETQFKPWKKMQVFDREAFRKELIDAQHFLLNLFIAAGMDADMIYKMYTEKNNINHERKEEGY